MSLSSSIHGCFKPVALFLCHSHHCVPLRAFPSSKKMAVSKNLKKISPIKLSSLLRHQKNPTLAFQLFQNPSTTNISTTKPFRYTPLSYDLIITKLGRANMLPQMEQILTQMKQEPDHFTPKESIFCKVITFYGKSRLPQYALNTFNDIPYYNNCKVTVQSFNALLNALLTCKEYERIRKLFLEVNRYCISPDDETYSILINACCSCESLDVAWSMFDEMLRRGVTLSDVTFCTLIHALCVDGQLDDAFRLKEDMVVRHHLKPNVLAYTALITALFKAGRKVEAVGLLEEMREKCEADSVTYDGMISGFCGEKDYEGAFEILKVMVEKGCKMGVVTYNVVVGGLCKVGKVKEAMNLYEMCVSVPVLPVFNGS